MKNNILELFRAYETETEFDGQAINEKMYNALSDDLVKLFTIPDVSNQRELLIAFSEWTMRNEDSPNYITEADVEQYLSN